MKNICEGCPQFDRVCHDLESQNKEYCFFHHGHRDKQSFQCDDLMDLVDKTITETNMFMTGMVAKNKFTIEEYGSKDYYILLLYFVQEQIYHPIGYIKKRGKNDE